MVNTDGFWPMFIQCKPWQSTRDNQSIERGRNTILKGYYNSTSVLWRILMLESLNVRTAWSRRNNRNTKGRNVHINLIPIIVSKSGPPPAKVTPKCLVLDARFLVNMNQMLHPHYAQK